MELVESRALNPVTGEVIELAKRSSDDLGLLVLQVREMEGRLRDLKSAVSAELHRRWDQTRQWSEITPGGLKLSGRSDAPEVVWDADGVVEELDAMVREGLITAGARDRAVSAEVKWKVSARGINALMLSSEIARRLSPFRREVEPERRVSVSRV